MKRMRLEVLSKEQARAALQALLLDEGQDDFTLYELDMDDKKLYQTEELSIEALKDDLKSDWTVFLQVWE